VTSAVIDTPVLAYLITSSVALVEGTSLLAKAQQRDAPTKE
jgi:hypothetical protein